MQLNSNGCLTSDDTCPICQDTGWEWFEKDGHSYVKECRCGIRQKQIMENRLRFANIPEAFKSTRLNSFNTRAYNSPESQNKAETAVKAIKYWLDNFEGMNDRGMGLYLYSKTKGSGKTRMSINIANELMYEKKIQVKFSTSLQILNEIRASWSRGINSDSEYTENRLLDFLSTTEVLIIDDFGVEQGEKEWIREKFYHIINSRYIEKKITIFTSNSRLDLLRYDDRITNRIKERAFLIPFPEESVRDIIAEENMKELAKAIKG